MLSPKSAMFDTEKFIVEIEKRPAIYDVSCDEYNDRDAKMRAWDEVCQVMIPDWQCLSDADRINEEKILRGKWRNVRDYFIKELKLQRSLNMGPAARKRKKYMYYDRLLFLMPSVENKQRNNYRMYSNTYIKTEGSDGDLDNPEIEEYDIPLSDAGTSQSFGENSNAASYNALPQRYTKPLCETALNPFDNELNDMLSSSSSQKVASDNEDYDKMFLLSLLPILRQVPEDKKLTVRIQMQQVLEAAIYPASDNGKNH